MFQFHWQVGLESAQGVKTPDRWARVGAAEGQTASRQPRDDVQESESQNTLGATVFTVKRRVMFTNLPSRKVVSRVWSRRS